MRADRIGSIEDFKNRIHTSGLYAVEGQELTAQEVVDHFGSRLSDERRARIEEILQQRSFSVATVAEHLYDVGNISAVMRSAESFGFLPFYILERQEAKYKKSDRISKGTEKWLDIHRSSSTEETVNVLRVKGYKIYATSLNTTIELDEIDFSQKSAIVFGNEKEGISPEMEKLADGLFKIPMYGFAQSFNISVAAALVFSHVHRKRTELLGQSGDLTDAEKMHVRASYYLR